MFGISLTVILICFIIWLVPIVKIAGSKRTQGGEKLAWLILIIFIFWFAWIFYLLLAPLKQNPDIHR
tara:strand:+ start:522 stop:722 length:201 start_codon:yes stop_codon:yes gene_type:complete